MNFLWERNKFDGKSFCFSGFCNLTNLDEEKTHKISVDFDDHVAVIDVFITITGTAPSVESWNDGETSFNTTMTSTIETVPSKITEKDFERYVSRSNDEKPLSSIFFDFLDIFIVDSIDSADFRRWKSRN